MIKALLGLLLAALAYLLLWPVAIDPVAWTPQPAPEGAPYQHNEALRGIQRIGRELDGPEGIAFDAQGQLYAGLHDGRLLRFSPDLSTCALVDHTGGRPLGLVAAADGGLLIADARRGLLRLDAAGSLSLLSDEADGLRYGFTDDVDVASDGTIYFTDASSRFGYGQYMDELIEHGRRGRLLRFDPASGKATTLLQQRPFANGVTLGPGEDWLLFTETWEYRVTRYWLRGERAGQTEVFIDNLPGYPDNLSFNGRDRFWVALFAPRDALLDQLMPHPAVRKVVARLPRFLLPKPKAVARVIGLDLDGKVVADLRYAGEGAYAPITSVEERDGWLYFGSLSATSLGRIKLDDALAGTSSPPQPLETHCDS